MINSWPPPSRVGKVIPIRAAKIKGIIILNSCFTDILLYRAFDIITPWLKI